MAFAPLGVWLRMLWLGGCPPVRYWVRVASNLLFSTISTVVTLPERVLLWPLVKAATRGRFDREPARVVVVLGYFRSGTTHLHYLLSCDRRVVTPPWVQCVLPHGFWASWFVMRWVMVPFFGNTRPQDAVGFGPEWPAEDEFALCNRHLMSSMPGRFLYPTRSKAFDRWHALEVSDTERARWRDAIREVVHKLCVVRGSRTRRPVVVMKSPAHTARVAELVRTFGAENVRFVHLSREPQTVVRSNLSMQDRLRVYEVEPPPAREVLREKIIAEYAATEAAFERDEAALPPGMLSRMRYQDLVADPGGELARVYDELGLSAWDMAWDERAQQDVARYLGGLDDYTPRAHRDDPELRDDPRLLSLRARFGHDRSALEPRRLDAPHERWARARLWIGALAALLVMLAGGGVWLLLAETMKDRNAWMPWLLGTLIGIVALRVSGRGTAWLGVWCGMLVVLMVGACLVPLNYFAHRHNWSGHDDWADARVGARSMLSKRLIWTYMSLGVAAAFLCASRKHGRAPGR